jgi:hypothetical protein
LQRDLEQWPKASIDRVLAGKAQSEGVPRDFEQTAALLARQAIAADEPNRLKAWWIYRMLFGPDPLTERLTLLWHNHFATSNRKVRDLSAMPHAGLLSELASALAAFFRDLKAAQLAERVTVLAFSEFSRTVKENASGGTDHGTAGPVFLAGPGVTGGLSGAPPSLIDLDAGEPKMTVDFRRVYATVLADWLGLPTRPVLGAEFERLAVFRK